MADLSMARETGAEKSIECSRCGGELPMVESPYGSTAPGACPRCWPSSSAGSLLEAQKAAAASTENAGSDERGGEHSDEGDDPE